MDDRQAIMEAWQKAPQWDFNTRPVLRMPPPMEPQVTPVLFDPLSSSQLDLIQFHREVGTHEGRPATRIVGVFRETTVQVALQVDDARYPYSHHGPTVYESKLDDFLISEAMMKAAGLLPDAD